MSVKSTNNKDFSIVTFSASRLTLEMTTSGWKLILRVKMIHKRESSVYYRSCYVTFYSWGHYFWLDLYLDLTQTDANPLLGYEILRNELRM